MRNLIYVLNDGTVVRTMNDAKSSGQTYKVALENVPELNGTPGKFVGRIIKRK